MLPKIHNAFAKVIAARYTIREAKADPFAQHEVEVTPDLRMISQAGVFPPFSLSEVDVYERLEAAAPITLTCMAQPEDFFPDAVGFASDIPGIPHEKRRGAISFSTNRGGKPNLEFYIHLNEKLCPVSATSHDRMLRQLRAETFASEFLACWFIYCQIEEALVRHSGLRWHEVIRKLPTIPSRHSEPWEILRLLCPSGILRDSIAKLTQLSYPDLFTAFHPDGQGQFDKVCQEWEDTYRVSRQNVMLAIKTYLRENILRDALMLSGSCIYGDQLTDSELTVSDVRNYFDSERLEPFWQLLEVEVKVKEHFADTGNDWRGGVLTFLEKAEDWERLSGEPWGCHFQHLRG